MQEQPSNKSQNISILFSDNDIPMSPSITLEKLSIETTDSFSPTATCQPPEDGCAFTTFK